MEDDTSAREGEGGARSGAGAGGAAARVTLLHNAVIVTVDPASHVFRDGGLVVAGDRIVAIGQSADVLHEYAGQADEVVDLRGRFLLPGFINTHVHTSQQLARGIADDVDLMVWLHERIWPYESNMTEEDSYLSTVLCGIELIRSGVTCFAEAGGQHVTGMAKAVKLLGIRACLTQSTMDSGEGLPTNWTTNSTDDCIKVADISVEEKGSRGTGWNRPGGRPLSVGWLTAHTMNGGSSLDEEVIDRFEGSGRPYLPKTVYTALHATELNSKFR